LSTCSHRSTTCPRSKRSIESISHFGRELGEWIGPRRDRLAERSEIIVRDAPIDAIRFDRQHGEHEALPRAAEVDAATIALGAQAAEHP